MVLHFGTDGLKRDEIEKRVARIVIYTTPSIAHLIGAVARKNETSLSDMGHRALAHYLTIRGDLTEDEKEAANVAVESLEKDIKESRAKEAYRLSYLPKNLKQKCTSMRHMGRSSSYIVNEVITPTIDAVKLNKVIDATDVIKELEEIKKEFGGGE